MSKEKRARQKQNRQQQLAQKARAARAARWRRRLNFLPLIVGVAALLFWLAGRSDIETDGAAVFTTDSGLNRPRAADPSRTSGY